jgi:hypothetical protein
MTRILAVMLLLFSFASAVLADGSGDPPRKTTLPAVTFVA